MRLLPGMAVLGLGVWLAILVVKWDCCAGHQVLWQGYPETARATLAARSGMELAILACGGEGTHRFRSLSFGNDRLEARWQEADAGSREPFEGLDGGGFLRTLPRRTQPVIQPATGFWHWLGFGAESAPMVMAPPRERLWWISGRGEAGGATVSLKGSVVLRD